MQGVHPCDKRRSITEYHALFPAIDFSLARINLCCFSIISHYWDLFASNDVAMMYHNICMLIFFTDRE
jgi:hypothetical protein